MKKPSARIAVLTVACLLIACSKNEDKPVNSAANGGVPDSIQFTKPAIGPVLSSAQIDELKREFTVKSKMKLPPDSLIFPTKDMSKAEQMLLEEKLKREDPNSYDLLLQIRANCKKGRANMKYAATIPLDEVNSEADLAPGDKVDGSASAALVGSNCPLDYGGGIGMNAEVTGKDESSVSGNGGYNVKFNGVMKDGKYANLLGARGLLLDAGISAMAVRRDVVANKNDRILADFKMTGTFLSIKNSIPFSADVKALISNTLKDDKVSNASLEIIADLKIQMPNFSANLVIHQKQKDNVVTEAEYFLNGHEKTKEELSQIFGEDVPGSQLSKNATIGLLK